MLRVILKTSNEQAQEEASQLFSKFADWGDTEEEGEEEGESIYLLHSSTYTNVLSWCNAAQSIGVILSFKIEEQEDDL